MTGTPTREYWVAWLEIPGEMGPIWYGGFEGWTTDRAKAHKFTSARDARVVVTGKHRHIIHVTVTTVPRGQRAAWERVVKAADRWARNPPPDIERQDALDLRAACAALGPHRLEGT